jgi:hypothetical protein
MLYKIIESFSPNDGDNWISYCKWRGIWFECFDSIDEIMRPNVFDEIDDEDWTRIFTDGNAVFNFFTDFDYALRKFRKGGRGNLVGVCFDGHDESHPGFRGYDLLDSFNRVSLLTDFGCDSAFAIIDKRLSPRALVLDLECANAIRAELLKALGDDSHVKDCKVVSIYNFNAAI